MACSNVELVDDQEMVQYHIEASLDFGKADSRAATNTFYKLPVGYQWRVVLQVYDGTVADGATEVNTYKGYPYPVYEMVLGPGDGTELSGVVFNPTLMKDKLYKFVIWADVINASTFMGYRYGMMDGIREFVTYYGTVAGNLNDAFMAVKKCKYSDYANGTFQMELTRVTARLEIIADDLADIYNGTLSNNVGSVAEYLREDYPETTKCTYATVPWQFCPSQPVVLSSTTNNDAWAMYNVSKPSQNPNNYLFEDYIFCLDESQLDFSLYMETGDIVAYDGSKGKRNMTLNFADIPIKRNFITRVKCRLTEDTKITVEVVPLLNQDPNIYQQ